MRGVDASGSFTSPFLSLSWIALCSHFQACCSVWGIKTRAPPYPNRQGSYYIRKVDKKWFPLFFPTAKLTCWQLVILCRNAHADEAVAVDDSTLSLAVDFFVVTTEEQRLKCVTDAINELNVTQSSPLLRCSRNKNKRPRVVDDACRSWCWF